MKKTLALAALVALLLPLRAFAAHIYGLQDMLRLAVERAERLKISGEEVYISERQKDKARAALFPRLSAFGDYRRYVESEKAGGSTLQPESSASWGARLDYSLSLGLREPIAYVMAEKGVEKSSEDFKALKEEYVFGVAEGFYDVLRAKKALDTAVANVTRLKSHRDAAEARLRAGEATKTVLLRAEAELASAEAELVRAENGLRLSKAHLSSIVGLEEDFDITAPEPQAEQIGPCRSDELDCLNGLAADNRAELRSVRLQDEMAAAQVKVAKGAFYPSLSLEGVYAGREDEPSSVFSVNETAYGGLRLSYLFADGGQRSAELRQAKARLRQTGFLKSDLRRNIVLQVQRAYLELKAQAGLLEAFRRQLAFAKDNYAAVARQFELGLASSLDVMDANNLLLNSEVNAANAEFGYQMSVLRLRKETGTMAETILKE